MSDTHRYTSEELSALLLRTFTPRMPRECRPRIVNDVNDKGVPLMEFLLPHPDVPHRSIILSAWERRGFVETCSLRFGEAEIAGALAPIDAIAAIEEILADHIVAIVRYKNGDAFDNHRKISVSPAEWLYQLPDDEGELTAMLDKLKQPATLMEKLGGKYVGVFEMYRWSESSVYKR
jgi:hypothetical protein